MAAVKQVTEARDRKSDYDIGRVDYEWVEQ